MYASGQRILVIVKNDLQLPRIINNSQEFLAMHTVQKGSTGNWANGSRAQWGKWVQRVPGPNGSRVQLGQWAQNGSRAHIGQV